MDEEGIKIIEECKKRDINKYRVVNPKANEMLDYYMNKRGATSNESKSFDAQQKS